VPYALEKGSALAAGFFFVGTGRACEALDGLSRLEGFDSPVLRTAVQPNWNLENPKRASHVLTPVVGRPSLELFRRRA